MQYPEKYYYSVIERCSYYHVFLSVVVCPALSPFVQRVVLAAHQSAHQTGMGIIILYVHLLRESCTTELQLTLSLSPSQYGTMLHGTNVSKVTVSFVYNCLLVDSNECMLAVWLLL